MTPISGHNQRSQFEVYTYVEKTSRTAQSPAMLLRGFVDNLETPDSHDLSSEHTKVVRVPSEYPLPNGPKYDMYTLPRTKLFTLEELAALASNLPQTEEGYKDVESLLQNPPRLIALMRREVEVRRSQMTRPAA